MPCVDRDPGGQTPATVMTEPDPGDRLLLPREVAELFGVTSATVTRWANEGRLPSVQTPSGRRRFRMSEINRLRPAANERSAQ